LFLFHYTKNQALTTHKQHLQCHAKYFLKDNNEINAINLFFLNQNLQLSIFNFDSNLSLYIMCTKDARWNAVVFHLQNHMKKSDGQKRTTQPSGTQLIEDNKLHLNNESKSAVTTVGLNSWT